MHGKPDYGITSAKKTVYPLDDMGELAARLGSIDTFDRRGDVLFLCDFEDGAGAIELTTAGTGGEIIMSADTARSGGISVKATAGSDGDRYARMEKWQPFPHVSGVGLEYSIAHVADMESAKLELKIYTGTYIITFAIRINLVSGLVEYYNAAAGWTTLVENVYVPKSMHIFHTNKLVVDMATQKYIRFITDATSNDMAGISGHVGLSAERPNIRAIGTVFSEAGKNGVGYLDDLIITQNED